MRTLTGMDEAKLLARLLRGDEEAFAAFVDEYYPRLYRFAYARVGRDADAAQDIVQRTFQKVVPKLDQFRGEAALFSWLCAFCRVEVCSFWRERNRQLFEPLEDSLEVRAALESLAMADDGPEAELQRKELARLVRVVLDTLPIRYGNALDWKYLRGWSTEEIADQLGLSQKAAESILTRARQAFRDGFEPVAGKWSSR